jgi:hypothetical protein
VGKTQSAGVLFRYNAFMKRGVASQKIQIAFSTALP